MYNVICEKHPIRIHCEVSVEHVSWHSASPTCAVQFLPVMPFLLKCTSEPWWQDLERKHTQHRCHDIDWKHSCRWRRNSITDTELLILCSRAATKRKTNIKSTPSSVSQRSKRTNSSLHAFQFAAFANVHSVNQLFAHRSHTSRAEPDKRSLSKTSKHISSKIRSVEHHHAEYVAHKSNTTESFVKCRQNPIVVEWDRVKQTKP